jgi:hypothetical protein
MLQGTQVQSVTVTVRFASFKQAPAAFMRVAVYSLAQTPVVQRLSAKRSILLNPQRKDFRA